MFTTFINTKFSGFAQAGGKNENIKVKIEKPIITDEDINRLVDLINAMYQAYLVSANVGK